MAEQCRANNRPLPPEYQEIKTARVDVLNSFYHLSQRRLGDYTPVTDVQIVEYCVIRGSCGIPFDKYMGLVNRLDDIYLQAKAEKARADMEKLKRK